MAKMVMAIERKGYLMSCNIPITPIKANNLAKTGNYIFTISVCFEVNFQNLNRGVFRTHPNIYIGAFLRIWLTVYSDLTFSVREML